MILLIIIFVVLIFYHLYNKFDKYDLKIVLFVGMWCVYTKLLKRLKLVHQKKLIK